MKLLVYIFGSYSDPDLCEVLGQMNIKFDIFRYNFNEPGHNKNEDDVFVEWFVDKYKSADFDAVFSIDYFPPIALACYKLSIKYIAWSYDCPFDIIHPEKTLALPNVYCFVFDKAQQKGYNDMGLDNVYYMPLGVNSKRLRKITPEDNKCDKYRTEVSFVGKLYENSFALITELVNDKTKAILKNIVETQRKLPQMNMLDKLLTDSFVEVISDEMHSNDPDFKDEVTKGKVQYAIECEIARNDRIIMLNLLGKRYNVNFYSTSTFELLEGVNCKPSVDYWTEMPWIFAASKINFNPTLPAIHSGVNLRAFDITGCGGFMLMNRQPELTDFFKENEEIVIYDSIYDFMDKVEYYLNHDDKRKKIAIAGRERCLKDHNMVNRIDSIIKIVFG